MKLHLPKSLLTAVLAVGMALPMVYAEDATGIGNSYDKTYTYAGTVYTFAGDSPSNGTVTQYVKVTTRNDAENPTAWTEGEQQATSSNWASLYANETTAYNTLRITENKDYFFDFAPLTIGGVIVESGTEDASIYSTNTGSDRSIVIGKDGLTANSYFGDSFTFDNLRGNNNTRFDVNGKQTWYIANGESVTIQTKKAISNDDAWTISGNGTLSINQSITNNGSLTLTEGASLHVSNINNLARGWDAGTSGLTENGSTQLTKTYIVIAGGTSNVSSITYTSGDSTVSQNLTNNSYFAGETWDAYGVVTDTGVESIKDITEGIVSIKKGATLSRAGQSFTSAKQLAGDGTFAVGEVAKKSNTTLTNNGNVSLHESWTGTVSLYGGSYNVTYNDNNDSVWNINFNDLGNATSTVEIASQGLYGYLYGPGNQTTTFNPNILLTGDLTIQNGNGNAGHIFAGKISGAGNINIVRPGGDNNTHTFKNDISGWTGALNHSSSLTTNIKLEGNATEVKAAINRTNGYLNLTVNNNNKTTTFNKDVTVSKLTATGTALGEGVKVTLTGAKDGSASSISSLTADAAGNTIELKEGATLNRLASKNGGTVTLTGAGTYDMRGNYTSNVAGLNQEAWTGKVVVAGSKNEFNLNDYGNANSTIEIGTYTTGEGESAVTTNGYTGYLDNGTRTYESDLILTGDMTLTNGWGNQTKTFAGTITGSGDFISAYNGGTGTVSFTQHWKFSGDISGWDGNFTVQDVTNKTLYGTVAFTGTSEINLGSITKSSTGTLGVTISDADQGDTKSAVTVNSSITANSLTVNAAEGVALNNTVTVDTLDVQGTTKVTGTGDVTVSNTLTIDSAGALNMTGALVLTDASVDLSGFTVDTTTAQNTYTYTLAFAEGGITTGETINFTGLTGIDGYTATLAAMAGDPASGVALMADANKYLVLTLTSNNPVEPVETLTSLTINGGSYDAATGVLTFTTLENATDAVFGDTLNATMSEDVWAAIVGATTLPDEVLVSFEGADDVLFDFDNGSTVPTITINGEGTKGEQVLTGDGTIVGGYVTSYIPEPTTTTLSLLALAGLAVRRRRK